MKLIEIDKKRYKKHFNLVSVALVIALSVLSLAFGALFIAAFGSNGSESMTGESMTGEGPTGNFHLNLLGVILAAVTCVLVMFRIKDAPFMTEVYYVWRLKALHNRIYRRLKAIKVAAKNQDLNALIILNYYYESLKQVYFLDNNTLTMSKVEKDITELHHTIAEHNLTVSLDQFDEEMLKDFN